MKSIITIERHIVDQERRHPGATGEFSNLLYDVALAAKIISREITQAGLAHTLSLKGGINIQGEEQLKMDEFAHNAMIRMSSCSGKVAVMASEEEEFVIPVPQEFDVGKYALVFDPLDGSSNVNVNVSIGTIFGIYRRVTLESCGTLEDILQQGRKLEAAGYIIYGPSTMMVYSTGNGVHGFTLDPSVGEFLLSHPIIRFPEDPAYFSTNQGYETYWSEGMQRYTKWLQGRDPEQPSKALSGRYVGSLVADFHRNLLDGGVFYYPALTKDGGKPKGKLRLMFEAIPLSYIAEHAGGYGSDGRQNILDIQPESLHQRTPLIVGNRDLVAKAEEYIRRYDPVPTA